MKRTIISVTLMLLIAFGCSKGFKEKFSFSPVKPRVNQEIIVRYNAKATPLEKEKSINMLAYQFSEEPAPKVIEVTMEKKPGGWIGSFTPDSSTLFVIVKFSSDEKSDDNDRQGYFISLFNAEGNYLPGECAGIARAYLYGAHVVRLKRNKDLAMEWLQKEFELYPEQKEKHRDLYWDMLVRTDKENGKTKVIAMMDSLAATNNLTLEDKKLLANWYPRLKLADKAEKFKAEIRKAEPRGELVQFERFQEFYQTKDLKTQLELYKKFKNDFPESKNLPRMVSIMIYGYTKNNRFDEAESFLENEVAAPDANMYNSLAWGLVEKDFNLKTAAKLGEKGVKLARAKLEAPIDEKPTYLTEKEWRDRAKMTLGMVLDTYAFALYKLGQVEESVPQFEEAVQLTNRTNQDINERYANALLDVNKNDEAFQFLNQLIKEGKSSPGLNDLFKKAYVAVKGSEEGLSELLTSVKQEGINKLKEKLKEEMLDKPAPEFSLSDLNGDTVALANLKGKILVLDFWATWCGPCKASFPGMQQAVDKFKEDDSVEFLFINTWERGENVKKRVADFIKQNNYTFHVLMDLENKVVADYGVEGIPTKFIVDKNGKIRFKSVGFSGDADKLVDELSLMIDMLK